MLLNLLIKLAVFLHNSYNYIFFIFLLNMNSTANKLKEIIKLNRQLRNALSFKGGARKIEDFKKKLIENKATIFYLYIVCFFTIIYFCINSNSKNTIMTGGADNKDIIEKISIYIENITKIINENIEEINSKIIEVLDMLVEQASSAHEKVLDATYKLSPAIDGVNSSIDAGYSAINNIISTTPVLPIGIPFLIIVILNIILSIRSGSPTFFIIWLLILIIFALISYLTGFTILTVPNPMKPILIIYIILTYIVCNAILNVVWYMPCYMCEEGNSFYKCLPGTGKGSTMCDIYTQFINKIKFIIRQLKYITQIVPLLKQAIYKALNSILYLIFNISKWFTLVFSTGIEKIFAKLMFLKKLNIPDNWGFNFGEFIICPDFNTKGKACIYNKDGSLRSSHGNNPIFKIFWKMIRIIVEVPPAIPKFPFSGGAELKLDNLKEATINQPDRKKHKIKTPTKPVSKKPPFDKNIVYKKILETLIKIEINPIKWIAALFNLLIEAMNFIMKQLVNMLKAILSFIFKLITMVTKAITGALKKIINTILKPLNEVANLAIRIPKQLFKAISKILDIGIYTLFTYFFYNMLTSIFPFLDKLRSFIIIIAIVILIHSILIVCPIIGGIYAFLTPIIYIYKLYVRIMEYAKNYEKILEDINAYLIVNNKLIDSIKKYVMYMDDIYKIVAIVCIVLLILFIILNYFFNMNRIITTYGTRLIYGHYYNKFSIVKRKLLQFKLSREKYRENNMIENTKKVETEKKPENNTNSYFNNLLTLNNVNYNQLTTLNLKNLI